MHVVNILSYTPSLKCHAEALLLLVMLENEDKAWVLVCCVIKWIVVPKCNEFLKLKPQSYSYRALAEANYVSSFA